MRAASRPNLNPIIKFLSRESIYMLNIVETIDSKHAVELLLDEKTLMILGNLDFKTIFWRQKIVFQ